jgi:hypothetical protein
LDPALAVGDIVVTGEAPSTSLRFVQGGVHSADRVAVTAREKRQLRASTGAVVVETADGSHWGGLACRRCFVHSRYFRPCYA